MLSNKRFNIILSLIIAVGLWAYVIGEINPSDTRTFREIPISMLNSEVLEDNDLAVLETSDLSASVTVTGTRSNINKVSEGDITASIDLSEASEGSNELKINFKVPEDVEMEESNITRVTVVIETRATREVDIEANYQGTFENEQEPITVDMSRSRVTVSGARSLVESIDHVNAVVEEGRVTSSLKSIKCNLVPVDESGAEVENVQLSAETVTIAAELASTKTVTLNVPVTDNSSNADEKTVTTPRTVIIKGQSSDLEDIDSITTEEVNLTDVTENTTITLVPILPEGVQVSERTGSLVMSVEVSSLASKTFTFEGADVDLSGLGDEFEASIRPSRIEVTVRGTQTQIDAIRKADISLSLALDGLEAGTHQVTLSATCSREHASLEIEPEIVRVNIE